MASTGHKTILDIGPSPDVQAIRTKILRQAGYNVVSTRNLHEAVLLASECQIDGIILCRTFTEEERQRIAHQLAMVAPITPILPLATAQSNPADDPGLILPLLRATLRLTSSRSAPESRV